MKFNPFQRLTLKPNKVIGYLVLILVFLMGASVVRNISRVRAIRVEIEKERLKVVKMEEENKRLEEAIKKTQQPEFVEKQIRDKLGLVKEGEVEVVLPDEETLKALAPTLVQEEDTLPDPIWRRWLKLFL